MARRISFLDSLRNRGRSELAKIARDAEEFFSGNVDSLRAPKITDEVISPTDALRQEAEFLKGVIEDEQARVDQIRKQNEERTKQGQGLSFNQGLDSNTSTELLKPQLITVQRPIIGSLCMFGYEATTRKKLKYWDQFPNSIILDISGDSFFGLNFHYLPPIARARVLDSLMQISETVGDDEEKRMVMSYEALKGLMGKRELGFLFKHYKFSGVKTRIKLVPFAAWELAIFMPSENFTSDVQRGINKLAVWQDFRK